MTAGEITFSEFTSILALAPHSKNWSVQTCEILVQLEDPKIRFRALVQLVSQRYRKGGYLDRQTITTIQTLA